MCAKVGKVTRKEGTSRRALAPALHARACILGRSNGGEEARLEAGAGAGAGAGSCM